MRHRFAIACILLVSASAAASPLRAPVISLSTTGLAIGAPAGGPNPSPTDVTITNTGSPTLGWNTSSDSGWLTCTPPSGSLNHNESAPVSIIVNVVNPPPGLTPLAAGTYIGKITFSASGASSVVLTVTLTVSSIAQISLNPTSLAFSAAQGGPPPAPKDVTIQNSGGAPLNWSTSFTQSWIHVAAGSPSSGTLGPGASVSIGVAVDNQPSAGTFTGKMNVAGVGATTESVDVTLTVSALPLIALSPSTLAFDAPQGGGNPSPQTVSYTNQGGQPITSWTASTNPTDNWLSVSPTSGATIAPGGNQPLTVSINTSPSGTPLAAGTYQASVTVTGTGATNTPQAVIVTLNVNATPKIGINPTSFSFTVSIDNAVSPPVGLSLSNMGSGTLQWQISGVASWLGVQPSGGSLSALASQAVLLTANGAGLAPGVYTTTFEIENSPSATTLASNLPQTIGVELTVNDSSLPVHAPAGQCGLAGLEGVLPILAMMIRRLLQKRGDGA